MIDHFCQFDLHVEETANLKLIKPSTKAQRNLIIWSKVSQMFISLTLLITSIYYLMFVETNNLCLKDQIDVSS